MCGSTGLAYFGSRQYYENTEKTEMEGEIRKTLEDRLRRLRVELEERKSSIPIHSIRPHQLIEIEELEEEIGELEKKLEQA
jgi:hypothetical protein